MSTIFNKDMIIRTWDKIVTPTGGKTEIRILDGKLKGSWRTEKVLSGYFDDPLKVCEALESVERARGIYFVPNPISPNLLARGYNRLSPSTSNDTTSDHNITRRAWLLVDLDPVRESGISSTDAEKQAAKALVALLVKDLRNLGWADPVIGDSGNGWHMMYRIDLPNDVDSLELVSNVLAGLDARYSDDAVHVDVSVKNASRIWKLYGTMAAKGDNMPDRPHRKSVVSPKGGVDVVTAEQLAVVAGWAPQPTTQVVRSGNQLKNTPKRSGSGYGIQDALALVQQVSGCAVARTSRKAGYNVHELDRCVCDRAAAGCAVTESDAGGLGLKCQHGSCSHGGGKRPGDAWKDFRSVNDPSYKAGDGERVSTKVLDPEVMDQINKDYAYLRNEGYVLRLSDSERIKPGDIARASTDMKLWLDPVNGPNRNDYDKMVFDPTEGHEFHSKGLRVLNLFDATELAPNADPKTVRGQQGLRDFWAVLGNLCRDQTGAVDHLDMQHLYAWIAYALRYPERRQTACIFVGETGTGKGTLQNIMRGLFGAYVTFPGKDALEDSNTGWLESAIIAMCDELSAHNMKDRANTADRLLTWITEGELTVTDKWVKRHKITNHCKWMLFSNQHVPVLVRDNDRRYNIFKSWEKLDPEVGKRVAEAYEAKDMAYFGAIATALRDWDLSTYQPWVQRDNAHLAEIKSDSADGPAEFWKFVSREFPAIGSVSLGQIWTLFSAMDPATAGRMDKRALSRCRPGIFRTDTYGKDKATWIVRGQDGLGDLGRARGLDWLTKQLEGRMVDDVPQPRVGASR